MKYNVFESVHFYFIFLILGITGAYMQGHLNSIWILTLENLFQFILVYSVEITKVSFLIHLETFYREWLLYFISGIKTKLLYVLYVLKLVV